MTDSQKEALIRKYIKAYNSKDVKGMVKCVSDDVVFKNMSGGMTTMEIFGLSSLRELATKTKDLFKMRKQTIKEITFNEDHVRVEIHFDGVFGVSLPSGVRPGQRLSVDGYSEFKFGSDDRLCYIADISE